MTMYDRGTVVVINMRWPDGSGSKPRPATILSTDAYREGRQDIIVVGLTANLEGSRFGDYALSDWQPAGLRGPTKTKGVLATVKRSAVRKQLGTLSETDLGGIETSVREVLGI